MVQATLASRKSAAVASFIVCISCIYLYQANVGLNGLSLDEKTTKVIPFSEQEQMWTNVDNSTEEPLPLKTYNFTMGICSIVKDAEAYLNEFCDYHLLAMGFSNIYIYDNSVSFDLKRWSEQSRDHPVYSRVKIFHRPRQGGNIQRVVFNECVNNFGKDGPMHKYMALIDVDEFLVLSRNAPSSQKQYDDIQEVLEDYVEPFGGGALTVNWMMFGTANHTLYAPIPVTKRFQYRDPQPISTIKTIVRSQDYVKAKNPHGVELRKGTFPHTTKYPGAIQSGWHGTGASDSDRPSNVVLLYHYRYTSLKEYIFKRCVRGQTTLNWCEKDGKTIKRDAPDHIQAHPGTVFDDTAWQFFTSRVPKYRFYDTMDFPDFAR